jgi:hypothetical protein
MNIGAGGPNRTDTGFEPRGILRPKLRYSSNPLTPGLVSRNLLKSHGKSLIESTLFKGSDRKWKMFLKTNLVRKGLREAGVPFKFISRGRSLKER